MPTGRQAKVAIIGAGMAGLTCATELARRGVETILFDKGRGPGGRMATRRADVSGETVRFDHGAPYFTASSSQFAEVIEDWERSGHVSHWPAAGDDAWVGTPGMNAPLHAMADPLDVHWEAQVTSLCRCDSGWTVTVNGEELEFETVLLAIPAEQASDMLAPLDVDFPEPGVPAQSCPCWAAMVAFPSRIEYGWDIYRSTNGPISMAARDSAKPDRVDTESWVFHASEERSRAILELPPAVAARMMMTDFFTVLDVDPIAPLHLTAHRWRYAVPEAVEGGDARWSAEQRIGLAGDYLHSPTVEGAWQSGRALAEMVTA